MRSEKTIPKVAGARPTQQSNRDDTSEVLFKLLVVDSACELNASRAQLLEELLDTHKRTHSYTKSLWKALVA